MKRLATILFVMCISMVIMEKAHAQLDSLGDGIYRIQYTNMNGCICELQSFDSTFNDEELKAALSLLIKIGGKEKGLSAEFPSYSVLTGLKDKKQLIAYGKTQVANFQNTVKKLKSYKATSKSLPLKEMILNYYTKKLTFERITLNWLKSGNDEIYKREILKMHSGNYMIFTLDKVLAIKDWNDKFKYTYSEVDALLASKVYSMDPIIKLQVMLFTDNRLKIATDPKCSK